MINDSKKENIIRVLQILESSTDEDHHIQQKDFVEILESEYGLTCERRSIARNIDFLRNCGYDIEQDRRGYYLTTHNLEKSELRLLIDSVLASNNINKTHSKDLIDKLIKLGGKNFKSHMNHVYSVKDWNKSLNKDFFYNIEVIEEAIDLGCKISFNYVKYGMDKAQYISSKVVVSPYQMIVHNQKYYLMLKNEKHEDISFYRLDKISNIKLLKKKEAEPFRDMVGENGSIDYHKLSTSFPYLFYEAPQNITLECDKSMADEIIDWFGMDVNMTPVSKNKFEVRLFAGEEAVLYWILQYNNKIKVIQPESLKEKVISLLKETLNQYK